MSTPDISIATDPDLRASLSALKRAGQLAREAAVQTDTNIVVFRDGQLIHLSANELRTEGTTNEPASPRKSPRGALKHYAHPDRIADEEADWPDHK